jgi:hypothetical protein
VRLQFASEARRHLSDPTNATPRPDQRQFAPTNVGGSYSIACSRRDAATR